MDTSQKATNISRDREGSVGVQRQRRSIAEKRLIVEETLAPGASVARVAAGAWSERQPAVWLAQTLPDGPTGGDEG